MRRFFHSIYIAVLLIFITGCSQSPTIEFNDTLFDRKPPPEQWQLQGKLGIRTTDASGSVTLTWRQTSNDFFITIQGPLGQGNATVRGNKQWVVIKRPGKPTLRSSEINALILDTFGWNLPIEHLTFWVRGIPDPSVPATTLTYNQSGTIDTLEQASWRLGFSRYQPLGVSRVPGRIKATQDNAAFTLIIRQWQFLTENGL